MKGHKNGVVTQILQEERRALYTHCYGHSLNLAIADTVPEIKLLHDTLDTTSEISKFLKCSPKRGTMFVKLKEELAPGTPGFRTLSQTRWTVRAISLKSVLDNYIPLMELWENCLEEKPDSETKSRIIGVKSQMGTFEYYFGLHPEFLIFVHTDNLSQSLQGTQKSAAQGQTITSMTVKTLISLQSDDSFKLYWQKVSREAQELKAISKPKLPRKTRVPKRLDDGTAPRDYPPPIEDHYRSIYFQTLDMMINCTENRFDQLGYRSYLRLESLLLKAASKKNLREDFNFVCDLYKDDFERNSLKVQLESLAINIEETAPTLKDAVAYLKKLDKNSWDYFSEVFTLVKLILVVPATNTLSERSCSALWRLKTYL